jgi:hypothetical protein
MEEKMIDRNDDLREDLVAEAIDKVLDTYPQNLYGKAFANPKLRKTLMAHVLNQLTILPTGIQEGQKLSNTPNDSSISPELELSINNLIRQEIAYIMQQKGECISRSSPEEADACLAPSHWFG